MVYDKIWAMVAEDPRFASSVKTGNRISFGSEASRDPTKRNVSSADHPEVMLTSRGIVDVNLMNTSSSTFIARQYNWSVSSGDQRLEIVHAVEWAIFTANLRWPLENQLTSLQWENEYFVKSVNFISADMGLSQEELKLAGLRGWLSVWTMRVDMHFRTEILRNPTGS